MPNSEQEHEGRVGSLEQKMGLFDYRLTKSESILEKIEENLTKITILIEKHQVLREDLTTLENQFKARTAKTDPVLSMAERTIGKIQGAGLVIALFLGLLTWVGSGTIDRVDVLEKEHKTMELKIQHVDNEIDSHIKQDNTILNLK
mgnify:CR=1 FL=1